jgi:hypothetical protein
MFRTLNFIFKQFKDSFKFLKKKKAAISFCIILFSNSQISSRIQKPIHHKYISSIFC